MPSVLVASIRTGITSFSGRAGKAIVAVELLRPLAQRVAVVRPFVDDIDRLPGMQPDHHSDQVIVCAVRRIDVPREAMRIAQAVRPDLFPGAGFRRERVILRDAVTSILADRTAVDMLFEVRDNAKDFTHQHVEPLRIAADARASVHRCRRRRSRCT